MFLPQLHYTDAMQVCYIGDILKEARVRLHISQEELSFDLCSVPTLSRIESGKQVPGRKLVEALFSKMGMVVPAGGIPMTKIDLLRSNLEYQMTDMLATGNTEIAGLLEQYRACGGELDSFEMQFYLFFKALYESEHGKTDVLSDLEKALRLTIRRYVLGSLPVVRFLTKTELLILNNIALNQYALGEHEKAIALMEFVRAYFENGIMLEEEKAKNYPVILHNLENWYGQSGLPEKVLSLCEIGIDVCIRYGKLTQFPYHIFNKGYALALLGKKDEAKVYIAQAFNVFDAMKKHELVVFGAKSVNETFGFDFPTD